MKTIMQLLITMLLLIGCAEKRPYEKLKMPDKQIFAKKMISQESQTSSIHKSSPHNPGQEPGGTGAEFLFLASTLGAPRHITSQRSNYQGEERIVRLVFEKDALKAYQVEEDDRFADNVLNERPILNIPVEHLDFKCATNDQGDCTNKEILDDEKRWQEKQYFSPNFSQVSLTHLSELRIFTQDDCFEQTSQKTLDVEFTQDVLNIEIEKEYRLRDDWSCVAKNFDFRSYSIKNPSFKVRYFYSIVRLNLLASSDYQTVEYPIEDQLRGFGFFKSRKLRLRNDFDHSRPEETYYLNRFRPGSEDTPRRVNFHLSATFNKTENLYLRDATYRVIANVNQALSKAHANLQLDLIPAPSLKEEKRSGDLRYNTIVLVDEPLGVNLLGYGPLVANPRTGEILQAHTNMYSGVLKSSVRRTYRAMERLSKKKSVTKAVGQEGLQTLPNIIPSSDIAESVEKFHATKAEHIHLHQLSPQHREDIQASRRGIDHTDLVPPTSPFRDMIEHHSRNNAYHIDMVNFTGLGKELIPGIKDIPDILTEKGYLKPWDELTEEQRDEVTEITVVNLYMAVLTHELGHNLGLRHNFMASADADNFYTEEEVKEMGMWNAPQYSSIMDYPASGLNELAVFGKYDIAALRYAYAREIEIAGTGGMVKVLTSLADIKAELAPQGRTIKRFYYCTDENAGLSPLCNRFDEGSSLQEVATFYVESYENDYEERNWRNGRLEFNKFQLPSYILGTMRRFRLLRKVFEQFEASSQIYGESLMLQGCTRQLFMQYPDFCKSIHDVRNAAFTAGNFFVDLLKTPDLTCALSLPTDEENKTAQLVPLNEIYQTMRWVSPMTYVPRSCFDETIQDYLNSSRNHLQQPFKVKGEAGKYLNSIKDPNPNFPYETDIQARGIWSDKLLAMRYLTARIDENSGLSDKDKGSLADLAQVKSSLNNFFQHIIARAPLDRPVKFKKADGTEYVEEHFKVAGTQYKVAPLINPYVAAFFGLPVSGQGLLNEALVANAVWYNQTKDADKRQLARSFQDSLSVSILRRTTPLQLDEGQAQLSFGQYKYIAEEGNQLAMNLARANESWNTLSPISREVAQYALTSRTTLPDEMDPDTKIILKYFDAKDIKDFIKELEQMGANTPAPGQFAPPYDSIIRLGVRGLGNALDILREMHTRPSDEDIIAELQETFGYFPEKFAQYTSQISAAYEVDTASLKDFINGELEKRVEDTEENIKLLYSE